MRYHHCESNKWHYQSNNCVKDRKVVKFGYCSKAQAEDVLCTTALVLTN